MFLSNYETLIRLSAFLFMLSLMLAWESVVKFRANQPRTQARWRNNLILMVLNTAIVNLTLPIAAVGMAMLASDRNWGLFNLVELPVFFEVVAAIILLDVAIYFQHRASHYFNWFWRLHRVHHADPGFDVTTAVRFHPLEILLSAVIKISLVFLLGAPAAAVILFEVILNATAMFNHGNVSLPANIEKALRWVFVTPDMHRIHHSKVNSEHNANYGFSVSIWDRLFHSYVQNAELPQRDMNIGLKEIEDPKSNSQIIGLLFLPFK